MYGDVFTVRTGRRSLVVVGTYDVRNNTSATCLTDPLNLYQAANELLEKNGALTADRPRNIAVGEVLSGGMRVLILREGDKLKRMRR